MAEAESSCSTESDAEFESYFDPDTFAVKAPVVGYEVVEARKRFTVFKIHVQLGSERSWFVFRRYSDFVRLDQELKKHISDFEFPLPPKKYFGDNFEASFLENRKTGLQEYILNVLIREDTCTSQPAAEFFCFDDPPGPYDSLEESRAFIETLEDTVDDLKQRQGELANELRLVKTQLRQSLAQKQALLIALRGERVLNGKCAHDGDDDTLVAEYGGLPEVERLDSRKISREGRYDLSFRNGHEHRRLGLGRFPKSTVASQLDLHYVTDRSSTSPLAARRVRSTSDLTHVKKRNTAHLPSNGNLGLLDRFMRQSSEALQQIRISVREKLGGIDSNPLESNSDGDLTK